MSKHDEYLQNLTDRIVKQIEENKAPWQKPFGAGDYSNFIPVNVNGKPYNGVNLINLMSIAEEKGYADNRWLTFNGARELGGTVKKGEKASDIYYWKFTDTVILTKKDKDGNDVLDDKGDPIKSKVEIKLDRPQVFFAKVFNADQIEGLPPRELTVKKLEEWERHEAAERILEASGVKIIHKPSDGAYYSPAKDHIVLPERSQFATHDAYYATALHELGHATGHSSRLNRDLSGSFGSESYAKEELRAEMASMLVGQELQIGHDPSQHIAYLENWALVVKNDPKEIFKAVKDADAIQNYILALDPQRTKDQIDDIERQSTKEVTTEEPKEPTAVKTFIDVPYKDKNEAKELGAKWDKENKSWFIPDGEDHSKFAKWLDHPPSLTRIDSEKHTANKTYLYTIPNDKDEVKALGAKWDKDNSLWYVPTGEDHSKFAKWLDRPDVPSPEQSFADHLKSRGIVVDSGHPKMDGKQYRLKNEGSDSKNVLYQLYPNDGGIPSGRITNFSRDAVPEKWVYPIEHVQRQQNIDAVDRAKYGASYEPQHQPKPVVVDQSQVAVTLPDNKSDTFDRTAQRAQQLFAIAPVAENHDYLNRKGVGHHGVARIVPDASALPENLKNDIVIINDYRQAKEIREQNPDKMVVQKDSLIIPKYNLDGELRSFETIGYNGAKYALKDGEKNGLFLNLGKVENGKPFVISEGYATGATFSEQAKIPVVVSFGKGNLAEVAQSLREKYPDSRIYFAADNDHANELAGKGNAGVDDAMRAAKLVDGRVLIPKFDAGDTGKDWNDIFIDKGAATFRAQLKDQLDGIKKPVPALDSISMPGQTLEKMPVQYQSQPQLKSVDVAPKPKEMSR